MPEQSLEKVELEFCFKGARNYVQGGDIYDAICEWLAQNGFPEVTDIDLSMHRLCSQNLTGEITEWREPVREGDAKLVFRFKSGGKRYTLSLRENGVAIRSRNPYPEEDIIRCSETNLNAKSISIAQPTSFTNIEIVVALNKELLKQLFPETKGKWYFTRLQLDRPIGRTGCQKIEVKFCSHFNFKLTKSLIEVNSGKAGSIYYSLGK